MYKKNIVNMTVGIGNSIKNNAKRYRLHAILGICLLTVLAAIFAAPAIIQTATGSVKKELPIYCVDKEEPVVALTFDAAWGNEDTEKILSILEKHDIKVTFFATGGWVESYPEDVKKIIEAGHAFGNHSENHKYMTKLSNSEIKEELMLVHNKVKELTGYEMCLFRPPYGDYSDSVIKGAEECGYYTIQWSVDSLDWKDYGVDSIIKTVTQHKALDNGAIILMHNGSKYTADALDTLITNLKEQGYSFVTVSELIYKDNYSIDHTGKQIEN